MEAGGALRGRRWPRPQLAGHRAGVGRCHVRVQCSLSCSAQPLPLVLLTPWVLDRQHQGDPGLGPYWSGPAHTVGTGQAAPGACWVLGVAAQGCWLPPRARGRPFPPSWLCLGWLGLSSHALWQVLGLALGDRATCQGAGGGSGRTEMVDWPPTSRLL